MRPEPPYPPCAGTRGVEANAELAQQREFPYPLLCDTEKAICLAHGACESSVDEAAKRITYVIGPDATIAQAHAEVDPRAQPEDLLATL